MKILVISDFKTIDDIRNQILEFRREFGDGPHEIQMTPLQIVQILGLFDHKLYIDSIPVTARIVDGEPSKN